MTAFVDTSYYIARIMTHDQWHAKALRAVKPGLNFCTSALVLNETISLLQSRGLFTTAISFLRALRASSDVMIVYPDAALQSDGWDLFARWGAAGANAVDCVSFAIMRRLSIRRAFTFDEHFRTAGFEILK
jgi:predicted nucleic acid-binding protein